jgi:hypothetical protein
MKGGANIVCGVHSIRRAYEQFESFQREYPNTKGANMFKRYNDKLEWIVRDLISHENFTEEIRNGLKSEWNSDVFVVPAIEEKVSLLKIEQRDSIEYVIDKLLEGNEVEFTITK